MVLIDLLEEGKFEQEGQPVDILLIFGARLYDFHRLFLVDVE